MPEGIELRYRRLQSALGYNENFPLNNASKDAADDVSEVAELLAASSPYVQAAFTIYSVLESMGLFGPSEKDVGEALDGISNKLDDIISGINHLKQRQETIRLEIISAILEVEYRDVSSSVYGITQSLTDYLASGNAGLLSNIITQSNINDQRISSLLSANESENNSLKYIAYFNLFITNSASRITSLSLLTPSSEEIASQIVRQKEQTLSYFNDAKAQMYNLNRRRISRMACGDFDCFHDDDGRIISCTLTHGYQIDNTRACTPVVTSTTNAGPVNKDRRSAEKQRVDTLVNKAMAARALLLTEVSWEPYEVIMSNLAATSFGGSRSSTWATQFASSRLMSEGAKQLEAIWQALVVALAPGFPGRDINKSDKISDLYTNEDMGYAAIASAVNSSTQFRVWLLRDINGHEVSGGKNLSGVCLILKALMP